jgi:prevent-host-death family protein
VEATLTELARKTREVVRPVQAGKEVILTEHGKPIAKIVPIRKSDRKRLAEAMMSLGPIELTSRK